MKHYILILLVCLSITACKQKSILDQLLNEPSITVVGELTYVGNAPFQEPALRIEGIKTPLYLAFEDPTLSVKINDLPQYTKLQAIGHLEKVEKVTADQKYHVISYTLNLTAIEKF